MCGRLLCGWILLDSFGAFAYVVDMNLPPRKIDQLAALMRAGDWERAIKFAAKFPRLEQHRDAILTASSALLAPRFYADMGRDPQALVAAGVAALKERYSRHI